MNLLLIIFFIGIILIIDGYYREKVEYLSKNKRVEYRFIPRNQYEDVLGALDIDMFERSPENPMLRNRSP